jgi:3-hydroxyisobutyrate dehydrogenase-like beta-hydroxyacid dehydrogenase
MCVTNTPIAKSISEKISKILNSKTLIIDITTHNKTGSIETENIFKSNNINYIECPVMGGPGQAEEGILGGIVGGSDENFKLSEPYLKMFCKDYFYFGPVGMGAKSKLLNNFLSLGNAALVNHLAKTATELGLDLKKVFDVAKLGSGNSAGLIRIFESLLKGDFKGFKFTATNSVKDLSYIQDLLKDFPEAEKVAEVNKNYFQKAVDDGYGESFISELINKK